MTARGIPPTTYPVPRGRGVSPALSWGDTPILSWGYSHPVLGVPPVLSCGGTSCPILGGGLPPILSWEVIPVTCWRYSHLDLGETPVLSWGVPPVLFGGRGYPLSYLGRLSLIFLGGSPGQDHDRMGGTPTLPR